MLHHDALSHSNLSNCGPQLASDPLEILPHHLQARVIEAVANTAGDSCLSALLDYLPSRHHAAVLAAYITPDKMLIVPHEVKLHAVAKALTKLPDSPPPLLSLRLECEMLTSTSISDPQQLAATAVAAALRLHTGLTSLSIPFYTELSIAEAVASLTSLRALQLGGNAIDHIKAEDTTPILKATLPSLSHLQDLKLFISGPSDRHPAQDLSHHFGPCREGSVEDCLPRLATLLSAVTALTSLEMKDYARPDLFASGAPLSLPCLKHLRLTSSCFNTARVLLRRLTAPLATLHITDQYVSTWELPQVYRVQHLWASLMRFQQLKSLTIDLDVGWATDDAQHAWLATVPPAIAALTRLRELSIRAGLPVMQHTMQRLARNAAAVQRLQLLCDPQDMDDCMLRESAASWTLLVHHLRRLRLQHLDVHTSWRRLRAVRPASIARLLPLTQLTALHLDGWWSCVDREMACAALAGMQELRSVCIDGFFVPRAAGSAYVHALGALPKLAQLSLTPDGHPASLTVFVEHAAAAAWPALQWLGLAGFRESTEVVIESVRAFPGLQHLALCDRRGSGPVQEAERARLLCLASDAGIVLSFEHDWERFAWTSAWT